jgi:hypothetical protein
MYLLMNSINNITKKFLANELKIELSSSESAKAIRQDQLLLKRFTSYTRIEKPFKIKIVLSIDDNLAKLLSEKVFLQEIKNGSGNKFIENAISEILNILIGNSTDILQNLGNPITFEIPKFLEKREDLGKVFRLAGWRDNFKTPEGEFILYYLHDFN